MQPNEQRFRLPNATFPVKFVVFGTKWAVVTRFVEGTGSFRCYLESDDGVFHVAAAADESRLCDELTRTGVEVSRASFVGTAFRHLVKLGLAERLDAALPPAGTRAAQ